MITAGVDVGNNTVKAVIARDKKILSWAIMKTVGDMNRLAAQVVQTAAQRAGLKFGDIAKSVSTGAGREEVKFVADCFSSTLCSAVGSSVIFPLVETGIDVGAEECRAFRGSGRGDVIDFFMNDKCAAGVGMFIEMMARVLEVPIEEAGALSLESSKELALSTSCVVFAESEVISLINQGESRADLLQAIHTVAAMKASGLLRKVGAVRQVVVMGGVALNSGFIDRLKCFMKLDVLIPENPQIVGAFGAALLAQR
ncbi:MAG: acyl-CoA dehydratase activase [Desulfobacterales bacterium]|nr:acyl-CoA dehydratase activase [Desulfobacterales bacterium]